MKLFQAVALAVAFTGLLAAALYSSGADLRDVSSVHQWFKEEAAATSSSSSSSASSSSSSSSSNPTTPAAVSAAAEAPEGGGSGPKAEAPVYVASGRLIDSAVGYGKLGLNGKVGFEGRLVEVKGVKFKHAVSMHTFRVFGSSKTGASSDSKFSFARFDIGRLPGGVVAGAGGRPGGVKGRRLFLAKVAINDNNNARGKAGSPVIFVLKAFQTATATSTAGGHQLWRSRPIQVTGDVDVCEVALPANATALSLEAHAQGSNACSHAVWLEPRLVTDWDT